MSFDAKTDNSLKYDIRLMQDNEIDEVLNIWLEHGLYEARSTIRTFKEIDSNAFWVAVLADGKF